MLAYAPRSDRHRLRPATLGLIVLGHVGLLAVVMTAKSAIAPTVASPPDIIFIPEPATIKPPPPRPQPDPQPSVSEIDTIPPILPPIPTNGPRVDDELPGPTFPPGPTIGTDTGTGSSPPVVPLDPPIVRKGPRFATVGDAVRPPYPDSMRQSGDEASLRLRLTIDERGRVTAVDPVGPANPTFLAAARRHILRVWRYQPAMEGSKAVPSTTTITLKFELGDG